MKDRSLVVVSAGLSQPSSTRLLADRLSAATQAELARLEIRAEPRVIDLRNHAHDVMNHLLAGFPSAGLQQIIEAVSAADGLIAVTPIFNASYSGLFKSFFDVLEGTALIGKPVVIAATGGTARHSLALEHALRPLFVYLRAVVTPTPVYAASEDWAAAQTWTTRPGGTDDAQAEDESSPGASTEDVPAPEDGSAVPGEGPLHSRIRQAARELALLMSQREPTGVADPFALPASFEDLLAGS